MLFPQQKKIRVAKTIKYKEILNFGITKVKILLHQYSLYQEFTVTIILYNHLEVVCISPLPLLGL